MAIPIEVKAFKWTCVNCRSVWLTEPDDEPALGAYLTGMYNGSTGGGPIEAFICLDCMSTSVSEVMSKSYEMESEAEEARDWGLQLAAEIEEAESQPSKAVRIKGSTPKRWTEKDKKAVLRSKDDEALAEKLGRSIQAVKSMRWKLQQEAM